MVSASCPSSVASEAAEWLGQGRGGEERVGVGVVRGGCPRPWGAAGGALDPRTVTPWFAYTVALAAFLVTHG